MKLINDAGVYYLDENGERVAITPGEILLFKKMTPLGRKMTLRRRAVEVMSSKPGDPEARLILSLFHLPAREWSFRVPD
jgi:hypothetical protein